MLQQEGDEGCEIDGEDDTDKKKEKKRRDCSEELLPCIVGIFLFIVMATNLRVKKDILKTRKLRSLPHLLLSSALLTLTHKFWLFVFDNVLSRALW